ncbi:MFS transporter [uncultured Chryseobacterium sp.]|uniref:MFS transporter n=1 Tax=uncultured Chryseobacterium sp. TaxID=259322 RepID=UPI002584D37E|nr:MFS transporter [uncultured Chryseobacterium sp.]
MQHNTVYHKWVPQWLKLPLLILALFPHLMLLSLLHSNSAFTSSFMDVDSDDIQYLMILMYGTFVVTLLVLQRFMAYFSVKYYVLLMASISVIILYILSVTNDYHVILVIRFLEGIFGLLEGAIFLPLIIAELKTKHAKVLAYLFMYTIMLTGGTITTSLLKSSIEDYDFQHMVLMMVYFHVFVLIIGIALFNRNRFFPKKPLYQLDITSWFLLWVCLQAGGYAIIYGKRLMWFESDTIIMCLFIFLLSGGLFMLKQRNSKRPLFHFEVFSSKNVIAGMILFFIFYLIRSGLNNVYSIMATVWKWPWDYIVNIQYWNVAGTLLGILLSGICLVRGVSSRIVFFTGFLLLAIDCAWFTYTFYPDTTLSTICPPLFLQGVAQGFLFTPLVFFLISGTPEEYVSNATALGTTTRFWTTAIGYALMQNLMLFLTLKHSDALSANLTDTNPVFYNQWSQIFGANISKLSVNDSLSMTTGAFKAKITAQSILLSNMEIFTGLFWLALLTAIGLLLYHPVKIAVRNIM